METWFYRRVVMNVPCPKCGGELILGEVYDWPADNGGECLDDEIRCQKCKAAWGSGDAPSEFDDPSSPNMWNVVIDDPVDAE